MATATEPNNTQTEEVSPFQPIIISAEDFTRLGLLTAEELETGENTCRELSVENSEDPQAASATSYEDTYSPAGMRTEYNRAAANGGTNGVTEELTLSASIYNAQNRPTPSMWKFLTFQWGRSDEPVQTDRYLSLTATRRFRDKDYNTRTFEITAINAKQDPENPDEYIVEFAHTLGHKADPDNPNSRTLGMREYVGRHQARRYVDFLEKIMGHAAEMNQKEMTVRNAPDVQTTEVPLPLTPQ